MGALESNNLFAEKLLFAMAGGFSTTGGFVHEFAHGAHYTPARRLGGQFGQQCCQEIGQAAGVESLFADLL